MNSKLIPRMQKFPPRSAHLDCKIDMCRNGRRMRPESDNGRLWIQKKEFLSLDGNSSLYPLKLNYKIKSNSLMFVRNSSFSISFTH